MNRYTFGLIGLTLLCGLALPSLHRVGADPNPNYAITPQAGPWLICAASFTGPKAGQLAGELVEVIRRDYQLPAYLFDRGKDERRKQQEEIDRMRKTGRVRTVRIEDQFAVLVGGYKDMDSARKALDGFRKLKPPPDKFCDKGIVETEGEKNGQKGVWVKEVRYSPFWSAFVVRNPSSPPDQVQDKNNDYPFLKQLNADESYSLLKCPKTWTLAVQSFHGGFVVQQQTKGSKFLDMLPFGNKAGEQLNAAALQAHELAGALRKIPFGSVRFESYVLHTRNSSIVTVGAYDSPNDPKLLQDQRVLATTKLNTPGQPSLLFAQPLPMQVPKP